jgi:hypothetical protein
MKRKIRNAVDFVIVYVILIPILTIWWKIHPEDDI